jgi:hypothetical protein
MKTEAERIAAHVTAEALARWADEQFTRFVADGCTEAEAAEAVNMMARAIDAPAIVATVAARLDAPDAPARLQ